MKKPLRLAFCIVSLAAWFTSCDLRKPTGVYDSGKMETILYDYHMAQALAQQRKDSVQFYNHRYTEAVFERHHTTREAFDRSLLWYMKNTEQLYIIYDELAERLQEETQQGRVAAKRMGGDANTDTLELWSLPDKNYLLSNYLGDNKASFLLLTDSVFEKNDQVVWNFDLNWFHHRDDRGDKRATAMLILNYEGDSIVTTQRSLYRSGHESISMRIAAGRRVNSVRGFLYLEADWSEKQRFLSVNNLSLLRVHRKSEKESK